MSLTLDTIREARARIAPHIVETPLLHLNALDEVLGCQVYVKLENMQNTGAFKLRGAMNKALSLSPEELSRGIVAASSGNHGKAIAYAAKMLGTRATIIMPDTAPKLKVEAIKALGAQVIHCPPEDRFAVADRVCGEQGATMAPPYNDETIMAGQGTAGLEIMEQLPEVDKIIVPASGGGLIGGVATAVKALSPSVEVYGAEPAALPRYSVSLAAGAPTKVEQKPTLADALVSHTPGSICFPYVAANVSGFAAVSDRDMLRGMKLLLTQGKILAEPSSCIGMGAVLAGLIPVKQADKVCFLITGGSVGLDQLDRLKDIEF